MTHKQRIKFESALNDIYDHIEYDDKGKAHKIQAMPVINILKKLGEEL